MDRKEAQTPLRRVGETELVKCTGRTIAGFTPCFNYDYLTYIVHLVLAMAFTKTLRSIFMQKQLDMLNLLAFQALSLQLLSGVHDCDYLSCL